MQPDTHIHDSQLNTVRIPSTANYSYQADEIEQDLEVPQFFCDFTLRQLRKAIEKRDVEELNKAISLATTAGLTKNSIFLEAKAIQRQIQRKATLTEEIALVDYNDEAQVQEALRKAADERTVRQVKKLKRKFAKVKNASDNLQQALDQRDSSEMEKAINSAKRFYEDFPLLRKLVMTAFHVLHEILVEENSKKDNLQTKQPEENEAKQLQEFPPTLEMLIKNSEKELNQEKASEKEKTEENLGRKDFATGNSASKAIEDIKQVAANEKLEKELLKHLEEKLKKLRERENELEEEEKMKKKWAEDQAQNELSLVDEVLQFTEKKLDPDMLKVVEEEYFSEFYKTEEFLKNELEEKHKKEREQLESKILQEQHQFKKSRSERKLLFKESWEKNKKDIIRKKLSEEKIRNVTEEVEFPPSQYEMLKLEIESFTKKIEEKKNRISQLSQQRIKLMSKSKSNMVRGVPGKSPAVHGHQNAHRRVVPLPLEEMPITPEKLPESISTVGFPHLTQQTSNARKDNTANPYPPNPPQTTNNKEHVQAVTPHPPTPSRKNLTNNNSESTSKKSVDRRRKDKTTQKPRAPFSASCSSLKRASSFPVSSLNNSLPTASKQTMAVSHPIVKPKFYSDTCENSVLPSQYSYGRYEQKGGLLRQYTLAEQQATPCLSLFAEEKFLPIFQPTQPPHS